ncbi:hypothetical protein [Haloplasma contractile]|uniref:Uncharacterized protein n=1 Tax=Haloplasma contractile SSD-17B TaxID=1033810 RepID=F7Q0Q5_9MOLU|nr:hypothetical protein [Haloplasma contractile]ERJ11965.1 hypothetical protein HLPCO_001879 [Haloplasma contractile SSD-17B]
MTLKLLAISLIVLSIISLFISFYVGVYETVDLLGNKIQTNRVNDEFILFMVLSIFLFIIGIIVLIIKRND